MATEKTEPFFACLGGIEMPERVQDLVNLIQASAEPLENRLRAISLLGDYLARTQSEVRTAGIQCLILRLREEIHCQLVTHCMGVLSRVKASEAVMPLVDILLAHDVALFDSNPAFINTDDSLRLRCAAAQALGRLGDGRAIIPLMSILNDKEINYRLRLAAAESLGKIGDSHAVTPLIEILKDEREKSLYLKESAVKALGMLGDIRALEPLIDVLESKRGIRDKFNFLKERIIEAMGRIGESDRKATDTLLRSLMDDAPSIRLAAVEALGEIGDADCLPDLQKRIFDEDDEVAKAAILAIYHIGGEDSLEDLLTLENLPRFLREELEGYFLAGDSNDDEDACEP